MLNKKFLITGIFFLIAAFSFAQDVNLDSLLDAEMNQKTKNETQFTEGTFKTSRLNNSQSVETTQKGVLDLKISHRFGSFNQGFYNLFGVDNAAAMRFGADYGITNRLTIGGGRSSFQKEYDGFLKYKILWQSTGKHNMPVSLSLLGSVMQTTDTTFLKSENRSRTSYAVQALLARKFGSAFSLQLMPTFVYNNHNNDGTTALPSSLISIGAGARLKLTKHSGLVAEYYYQLPKYKLPGTYNSFSLGYEIETGGHVFQLMVSNSLGITDRTFITETPHPWDISNLHFGFNISRVFTLAKSKDASKNQTWSEPSVAYKQDSSLTKQNNAANKYVLATFKTTRLINGHTLETTQAGVLDLKVTHRFGTLNQKFYNLFGLDYASMRIGLDYGITNRLSIGAGRSTGGKIDGDKDYDGFLKYRLLWQTEDNRMPISLTVLSSLIYNTVRNTSDTIKRHASDRFYYANQILIGRKFGDAFSLQLMPTMVHYNIVPTPDIPNDLFSVGAAVRIRLTARSSLNLEYYYQLPGHKLPGTSNSFGIGYEIETGGHVFQLQFTNSTGMTERSFITGTTNKWEDGGVHFGFNISRVFAIKKPKS